MNADAFPVGATVHVVGARGLFTVRRHNATTDRAVFVWGGTPMRQRFRAVAPDKLRPAKPGRKAAR